MRPLLTLGVVVALALAGAAQARGHRSKGLGAAYHHASATPRRHRPTTAKIESLGPSTFEPVKPYKGFSYLEHGKRRRKTD
jgi:hypothetical protein